MPKLKKFSVLVLCAFLCPMVMNAQNYSNTTLAFDGVDDFVNLGVVGPENELALTGAGFTIETWIYHTFSPEDGAAGIVDKSDGKEGAGGYSFSYDHYNGQLGFYTDAKFRYKVDTTLTAHKWYHLALTSDGTVYSIFINGNEVAGNEVNPFSAPPFVSSNISFGKQSSDSTGFWKGRIDELRFWNSVRTKEQIQTYMNVEIPGDEVGLVGYYRMNTGDTVLTDNGINSFNGILNNFGFTGSESNWITSTAIMGDKPSGSGTEVDPYQLSTIGNLYWLSNNDDRWEKHYVQTNDIDARITSSWRDGNGFFPMGGSALKFTGSYDGQNRTISNLYIKWEGMNIGFFGNTNGAKIENVNLLNSSVLGSGLSGSLVGQAAGGTTIFNCSSKGVLDGKGNYCGGLVGWNNNSEISQSYSIVEIDGYGNGYMVGGLVGLNAGVVKTSFSMATVSGIRDVGGLIGVNSGTVSNSYSKTNVIRETGSYTGFGGFVGVNSGTIEYCYATGSVIYNEATDPTDKGFEGAPGGTNTSCFFDSDLSNQISSNLATGKTSQEMKTLATFTDAGWDFVGESNNGENDYWIIDISESANSGYPYLDWEDRSSQNVELASFYAVNDTPDEITLNWTTNNELENLGFVLERKTAESDFETIASYETNPELKGENNSISTKEYSFADSLVLPNVLYTYRLSDIDVSGNITFHPTIDASFVITDIGLASSQTIENFMLYSNYPNPFNPETTIRFDVPLKNGDTRIKVRIFNNIGQIVETMVDGIISSGQHTIKWNAADFSSGVYYLVFESGQFVQSKKMVLLR
ncbi:MAG: T9SS C-terminal target domain-containing protein [Calditrichaeota bacterium]|nr:MAG: T9SS C-terminal target domain-containing protein [Calditrichota bacterium]MBL1204824.1 T9SS C-terminal target domain-containing protein [Calditrichota bacterium]NOG44653.1 T9SS type A sorting domain-containing protein [Calditrichota bacterium]